MIAYRAESVLAEQIALCFARHEDQARRFLQHVFQASAALQPDAKAQTLTVRFHGLGTPREARALAALCQSYRDRHPLPRHRPPSCASMLHKATFHSAPGQEV